jgi:hypothetical protein
VYQLNVLRTPPPLCDFEQWIDTEIKEEDKEYLHRMKAWDTEWKELLEQRRQEEAVEKEWKEELERRHAAQHKEEREQKLERVRRAKATMEENPDALRKGKWPCCTQKYARFASCMIYSSNNLVIMFSCT